jgi:hypothetical protein
VKAQDAEEVAQAGDLLAQVRSLQRRALAILDTAEQEGDLKVALRGTREARGNLELLSKLLGELDERPQLNVLLAPECLQVRAAILAALAPYTEARAAVTGSLARLEAGSGSYANGSALSRLRDQRARVRRTAHTTLRMSAIGAKVNATRGQP